MNREPSVPNVIEERHGFSTTVNIEIKQQASVNQLEGMTASELSNCVSSSLKKFLREQQLSSRSVRISSTAVLDNGDIKVVIRAKTHEDLQRFIDLTGWDEALEKSLIDLSLPTYKVIMHAVKIDTLSVQNRKEKSAMIRRFAALNRTTIDGNRVIPIIRDIRWPKSPKEKKGKKLASLTVEFMDFRQADHALDFGLYWGKSRYGCERIKSNLKLRRCSRCHVYGHQKCSAPQQCGKCAGQHPTKTCKSKARNCASCGGGHPAGSKICPAKAEAKKSLYFRSDPRVTRSTNGPQATPTSHSRHSTPAVRVQTEPSLPSPVSLNTDSAGVHIKSEPDQLVPEANATQGSHAANAPLLQRIDDQEKQTEELRKIVLAMEAPHVIPFGRTKRRAGEDLAEAESSNMVAKRIKQEHHTYDRSMGLWRQPSPFIVHRNT